MRQFNGWVHAVCACACHMAKLNNKRLCWQEDTHWRITKYIDFNDLKYSFFLQFCTFSSIHVRDDLRNNNSTSKIFINFIHEKLASKKMLFWDHLLCVILLKWILCCIMCCTLLHVVWNGVKLLLRKWEKGNESIDAISHCEL